MGTFSITCARCSHLFFICLHTQVIVICVRVCSFCMGGCFALMRDAYICRYVSLMIGVFWWLLLLLLLCARALFRDRPTGNLNVCVGHAFASQLRRHQADIIMSALFLNDCYMRHAHCIVEARAQQTYPLFMHLMHLLYIYLNWNDILWMLFFLYFHFCSCERNKLNHVGTNGDRRS